MCGSKIVGSWTVFVFELFWSDWTTHTYTSHVGNFYLQCDTIRWEQLENWYFSRGYILWTNDLILILKTSIQPYSYLEKVIICSVSNVWFKNCRLMNSVRFRTVLIWLHHTIQATYRELLSTVWCNQMGRVFERL